ncbi:MAG: 6-phosphogluconolactonase (cycloisomerase 2 family) [Chlamydiales bacterium]
MKQLIAILPLTLATLAVSCGGGGSDTGSTTPTITAPSNVTYGADRTIYLKDVRIEANLPSASGDAATWAVSPALPPGLALNASTGEIAGTPAAQTGRATYTVTATNDAGEATTDIVIAVEFPPRFAYAANQVDNTVSLYVVDPETGRFLPNGFFGSLLVQVAPQRAIAHPTGKWLYTPNLGNPGAVSPNISVYTIDQTSGRIGPGVPAGTGDGPFDMDFTPAGLNAYVAAEGSNAIWEYAIHPQTGALSLMSAPISHGARPTGIRVHPTGRFTYVAYNGSGKIAIYNIDPTTGALSLNTTLDVPADPRHMVMDPDGTRLYVSDDSFKLLLQYDIDVVTGGLTLVRNRPIGGPPTALTMHPTGAWIYAARSNGTLRAWGIDAKTGGLSLADNNVATGTEPVEISFDAAGHFAYVTNRGSNDVSIYKVDLATGALEVRGRTRTRATPGGFTTSSGIDRAVQEPRFLYAANETSDTLTPYEVSATTGQLTPIGGAPVMTGAGPRSLASDPSGRWLYTLDALDSSISFYALDPGTGAPTQIGLPHVFPGSGMPRAIAVDSSGRFAFVTTTAGNVEAYHIDLNTGELIYKFGTSSLGLNPDAIAVDPTGQFIYAMNTDSSNIVAIRFDQGHLFGGNEGAWIVSKNLTTVSGEVTRIRFSPSGERAYLTIAGDIDQVVPADIDPMHGTLTIGAVGSTDGADPVSAAVHPNGRFAFVALAGGGVAGFGIDQATGSLTKAFEMMVGLNPIDLIVDPSGRFLFVANEGGDDISLFAIDAATGMLSADGSFMTDMDPQAIELVSGLRQ